MADLPVVEEPPKQEEEAPAEDAAAADIDVVKKDDAKDDDDEKKDDDSDDSGKESVESDESSFHASDYENDSGFDPDKDPSEMLVEAQAFKEEGNTLFSANDLVRASRAYKKGISLLKPINTENEGSDEQVKALLVTLSNNLSMLCLKQDKPKLSLDVASKAVEIDDTNCKAHYRRAMAHKKLGMFKEARRDFKQAYKCDPSNGTVKKELHALVKYMTDTANREKNAAKAVFSFDNKTMSLYDDKMEEEKRKKEEEARKKKEEEDKLAARKQEWEDECVKLMAAGEEAISYEDWDKAKKKVEKAARKAKKQADRKKAQEEKAELERLKKERAEAKKKAKQEKEEEDNDTDDDDKLTEAELSQFRGYKKTTDGKTTSYFSREQSEHEKKLLGDITPRRLDENGEQIGSGPGKLSPSPSSNDVASSGKGKASAWNAGGTTWEEKDATDWCDTQLQFRLKETIAKEAPLVAVVTEVSNLTGEASVAVAGGRKRYIFDFHCNLNYEIKEEDTDDVVAKGELRLPDINSLNHDDFEVELSAWKEPPSDEVAEKANACQKSLVKGIRVSVLDFVNDFNGHY